MLPQTPQPRPHSQWQTNASGGQKSAAALEALRCRSLACERLAVPVGAAFTGRHFSAAELLGELGRREPASVSLTLSSVKWVQ